MLRLLKKTLLYWHTLRHLRPVQIYGRIWFRLNKPRIKSSNLPYRRALKNTWAPPITKPSAMVGPNEFEFLNQRGKVREASDWNAADKSKLWLYNLHYFDYLNADGFDSQTKSHASLLQRWISENPVSSGNGWEPYPISLRMVNWIKWVLAQNTLSNEHHKSLVLQARYLRKRLEWHLLGNHLLANAKALIFAGLFFEGKEAEEWLECGATILEDQIAEQVLSDGGHFELSPMYHSIILEDVLDLINVFALYDHPRLSVLSRTLIKTATRMITWLQNMSHSDRRISFFNDATFNIAAEPEQLFNYANRLNIEVLDPPEDSILHLKASGYIRVQTKALVLIVDVGHIGPDYIPGHAHADTLSFELSIHDQRVFVNSGISQYGADAERHRQRSTSAHNTVEIEDENSTEVWSGFRVARRASPYDLSINQNEGEIEISCKHDGYHRLSGKITHHRRWIIKGSHLTIEDHISGKTCEAKANFYLHPAIDAKSNKNSIMLNQPNSEELSVIIEGGHFEIKHSDWFPAFGIAEPNKCISVSPLENYSKIELEW